MVLQPTMLPVSVDQLHVLLILVFIVPNLLVRVLLDHHVLKPMELPLIPLHVVVALKDVLLIPAIATHLIVPVELCHIAVKLMALHIILLIVNAAQQNAPQPMD